LLEVMASMKPANHSLATLSIEVDGDGGAKSVEGR
jgi:hypothetical protein